MEATVLVYDASFPYCPFSLDNSDWSRNGDYHPNRFDAQREAAMSIFSAKTREHVESAVGIVLMAAEARLHETHSSSTLLVAPTGNLRLFESSLLGKKARISGSGNVLGALRQAQLQRQRIILFVCSPVFEKIASEELEAFGKRLKKNSIALDVVVFGATAEFLPPAEFLFKAARSDGNGALVAVESSKSLRQSVDASPIVGYAPGSADAGMEEMDPELAMAIRLSLQDQQPASDAAPTQEHTTTAAGQEDEEMDDELREAIALSLQASSSEAKKKGDEK